uniref:Uncharacterized protein n=1 Tax=Setaria viridis TaxID=4556 RepID=A0A4V6D1Q0_SETVI|nr:hypothetical protein SEVIR_9G369900v2 [Setaria viridis]
MLGNHLLLRVVRRQRFLCFYFLVPDTPYRTYFIFMLASYRFLSRLEGVQEAGSSLEAESSSKVVRVKWLEPNCASHL